MRLKDLGWNSFFKKQLTKTDLQDRFIGRISNAQKNSYLLMSERGETRAIVRGTFIHQAKQRNEYPVVGDWVVFTKNPEDDVATIQSLLSRKNAISRSVPSGKVRDSKGQAEEQVMASNIDTVFIVSGLDQDFNLRRIERYLALVHNSGATPVIVLNKADLCDNPERIKYQVESVALEVPIYTGSAYNPDDIQPLRGYLHTGQTVTLLGSSGAGKSTLTNALLGNERQKTQSVSKRLGKGVHTTTAREIILLPDGGMLIDTPGMREIQLYDDTFGLETTFEDIEKLAQQCRFSNCQHENEPGCTVITALENGSLDENRFQNFLKLKKELQYVSDRQFKME